MVMEHDMGGSEMQGMREGNGVSAAVEPSSAGAARKRRGAFLYLAAVFTFLPFAIDLGLAGPSVGQRYYFMMAAFLGAAGLALGRSFGWIGRRPADLLRPWIVLFAVALGLAAWQSPNWKVAVLGAMFPLAGLAFYMIVFAFPWTRAWAQCLALMIALSAFLTACYGLAQGFGIEFIPYSMTGRVGKAQFISVFGNPNFAGAYYAPVLLFIAGLPLWASRRMPRPPLWVAILAGMAALAGCAAGLPFFSDRSMFFTALALGAGIVAWMAGRFTLLSTACVALFLLLAIVRSSWLAVSTMGAMALAYVCWTMRRQLGRRFWMGLAAGAMVAAAAAVVVPPLVNLDVMARLKSTGSFSSRLHSFTIAVEMIKDRPWLGWGYDGFPIQYFSYLVEYQSRPKDEIDPTVYNDLLITLRDVPHGKVHNDLLEVAVDCGLLGVLALFGMGAAMILGTARAMRKAVAPGDARLLAFILFALGTVAVDGLFNFPLRLPASAMMFWGLLGIGSRLAAEINAGGAMAESGGSK